MTRAPRVALDVRRGRYADGTGIGRYVRELERSLTASHEIDLVPVSSSSPAFANPVRKIVWEQLAAPLAATGADLFHAPYYEHSPLAGRRLVLSVHDLDTYEAPERYSRRVRAYNNPLLRLLLGRAKLVLSPSRHTAGRLDAVFGVGDKTTVIPYGVSEAFFSPAEPESQGGYLLYTGGLSHRKNLQGVFAAFRALSRTGYAGRLFVTGRVWQDALPPIEEPERDRIVLTGALTEAEVASLYAGADLLLYPSLLEGFGFPVLEAFAAGCPVVTSTEGSVPELAGDAALLVDPRDHAALVDAASSVLGDATLRRRLVTAGRTRALEFSWSRTARETAACYLRALD